MNFIISLLPISVFLGIGATLTFNLWGLFLQYAFKIKPAGMFAHYAIGVLFAFAFIVLMGIQWLESPTLLPALIFGILMIAAPFFLMQPAMGLGTAASKTANPAQARFRSLMNHTAFGIGLYLFGLLANRLL